MLLKPLEVFNIFYREPTTFAAKANINRLLLHHCSTCQIYSYFLWKSAKEHQLLGCHLHRGGNSGTAGLQQHPTVVPEPAKMTVLKYINGK